MLATDAGNLEGDKLKWCMPYFFTFTASFDSTFQCLQKIEWHINPGSDQKRRSAPSRDWY